jgi:ketosteroid isomerase-like protein
MRTPIFALCLSLLGAAPAMAGPPAENEVLATMDVWKQAMIKKDRAALEKVLHPDLTYGHSSGTVENKVEAIEHVMGPKTTYVAINFADTKVRVQGKTALVTGKVELQERANGKDTTINLVVLTVWAKGPSGWQMIARQAAKPAPPASASAPAAQPAASAAAR